MNFVLKFIGLIPIKSLAKYLPEILAFVLTKVLQYVSLRQPEKLNKVIDFAERVVLVTKLSIDAGADGVFEPKELKEIAEAWKRVVD